MEKILALYDSDFLYATRFMDYINRKKESNIKISAFTREESLVDFLKTHTVDILLLGKQTSTHELPSNNIRYIYQLSDNPQRNVNQVNNEIPQIYRYQSVKMVMNEILSDYTEKESLSLKSNSTNISKLISVFSPVAGAEKLSFAWSLSTLMSEQGKVLFIMLDPLPVPLFSSLDNTNQNLSEFIYLLKENSNITNIKPLLIQNGKIYILSGIIHSADILSLSREDIQKWIGELTATSEFDSVVFFLGYYSEAVTELLNLSDTVFTVSLNDPYEDAIIKEWERQMKQSGMSILQEKYEYVRLHKQEAPEHMPLSIQELVNTTAWAQAARCMKA